MYIYYLRWFYHLRNYEKCEVSQRFVALGDREINFSTYFAARQEKYVKKKTQMKKKIQKKYIYRKQNAADHHTKD